MKILKILVICLAFLCIFSSCKNDKLSANGGILLDKYVLSSILKENEDRENSLMANDGDVFWTPSGKIWHASSDCSYLSNSKEIIHGTPDEARLAGKTGECSKCFLSDEDKQYEKLEGNPIEKSDVFFTKEGNAWHTDINCPKISGAEKIYNASIAKAKQLGKTHSCDECKQ